MSEAVFHSGQILRQELQRFASQQPGAFPSARKLISRSARVLKAGEDYADKLRQGVVGLDDPVMVAASRGPGHRLLGRAIEPRNVSDLLCAELAMRALWDVARLEAHDPDEARRSDILARMSAAIERTLNDLPANALAALAAMPDQAILQAFMQACLGTTPTAGVRNEHQERAWQRGREARDALERDHRLLTAGEAAERLGVSRQALDQKRRRCQVLGIRKARNWLYPELQFVEDRVVDGLDDVLVALPYEEGWALFQWLAKRREEFGGEGGRNAFAALHAGMRNAVVREAQRAGAHGGR